MDRALDNARALHAAAHRGGVCAHLLTERDGHSVLQMRAPHLEDAAVGRRLFLELRRETLERGEEVVALFREADLDARGEGVIRRLRHIRVIVRRDDVVAPLRLAAQLERAVAEHLVHIHIDRRARAALNRVHGELIDQSALDDLIRRLHEHITDLTPQTSRIHVCERRRLLHLCKGDDKVGVELLPRDVEVLHRAHRLYAVVNLIRHL